MRDVSLALYESAAEHARERGIILADTKFEFGLDGDGELTLGDEVLHAGLVALLAGRRVQPGRGQPSFDKQFVRDWASSTGWDRNPPAPADPRRRRRRARARSTSRPTSGSPASRSPHWLERTGAR